MPAQGARGDGVRNTQWHLSYLEVAKAHRITTGKGLTVAVIDSGVFPHRDLNKNLLPGINLLSDDRDGREDTNGHGTEMAGLIAGHGRSSQDGVLGLAPGASILPVKQAGDVNEGGPTRIAQGIEWASSRGAGVINVSLATGPSLRLNESVSSALAADALIVAGSGNRPRMVTFGYPAAIPGVLAVGAIDRSGTHAAISMTGPAVQICAPGTDITSTEPGNRYATFDGTSPATAIVSGAAALVRAKYPDLSAREVIHRLTSTATDIGKPGRDDECGYGILNIVKALTAEVPPLTPTPTTEPPTTTPVPTTTPEAAPASNHRPAIAAGTAAAALLLTTLLTLFLLRRRRRARKTP